MSEPIRIEMPTPFSVGPVNAYLFLEPEPVLVDCGQKMDHSRAALEAGLAEHGLAFQDIKRIIATHAHVDHVGLAGDFAIEGGSTVWASDVAYDWLHRVHEMWNERVDIQEETMTLGGAPDDLVRMSGGYMRQMPEIWTPVPEENLARFPIDGELSFGGHTWQVIYAPGHTRTQTCFFQPETGWLLSADMLLAKAPAPVIEGDKNGMRIAGLPEFWASLKTFEALEVSTVYPGHGPPMEDHRALIATQRTRIEMRRDECLELIKGGKRTAFEVTDAMYQYLPKAARGLGFNMVIGYLDLLLAEGAIQRDVMDGVWYFD